MARTFSSADCHPFEEVEWVRSDVVMTNWRDGTVNFEQRGVEFPKFWSVQARQIVTSKYFRGQLGSPEREWSLKQLIDRVVDKYTKTGITVGYFESDESASIFADELRWLLVHQYFSFNSPVWFNIGTSAPQQVSACFLLSVDDTMESILNWYQEEGMIFKGGSGSGVNLSSIRGSMELMSSGGTASGPVSFMRGADASAGAIKSGGSTRRAAKLVCLDVDHPDIEDFVTLKSSEERKIRVLRDAGFDMDLGGKDINSVQFQNANNSVRVTDEFMRCVESDGKFGLRTRLTGEVIKEIDARALFRSMALAAWECADPGIQYDTTINSWHTCPESGRISTSNPCSEYMHLDNSSCNLASLNLFKFMVRENGHPSFDGNKFIAAVRVITLAMDISICFADFPTEKITEVSRSYRQLGLGYANLGTLLMAMGLPYDSTEGRVMAGAITSLMSATAWHLSAQLAASLGAYDGFARNRNPHRAVVKRHYDVSRKATTVGGSLQLWSSANEIWHEAMRIGDKHGYRNAQTTLIAPTGTISFMMDCDTTGIEPEFALVKHKKLADGGSLDIVNKSVQIALAGLGYQAEQIEAVVEYITKNGHVINAPGLRPDHYDIFDCAVGERSIAPMGHVQMMAAVQPFLSGAISKTVNLPDTATVDDIEEVYLQGWKLGLKSLAVYRDGCKAAQPLSVKKKEEDSPHTVKPVRHRLPARRPAETFSFGVGGAEGYLTVGSYPDNGPGEIFLRFGKQGSTLTGLLDAFSIAVSIALQYGVPLDVFVQKFTGMQFEPRGLTTDPDVRLATSLLDYVFRRLALDHLPKDRRESLGVFSTAERSEKVTGEESGSDSQAGAGYHQDAPLCSSCGVAMKTAGVCFVCENCGSTSGCS